MSTYQYRVVEDRDELEEKVNKLKAFTNSDKIYEIPKTDARLLQRQLVCMEAYLQILNLRIEEFKWQ